MSLVINTNVASLSAQNSMSKAQMDQNEAMERLTTGKRINTAADDAAGIAVANKMTSQVKGLNQAVRNANDGISMLQTAAGGLEETGNILQRMRELSVQSATGTYKEGDRGSMQAEVDQLKSELDRISETTTFNGQKILNGSQKDTHIQVGANANETIDFDIDSTAARKLGGGGGVDYTGASFNNKFLDGTNELAANLTINGQALAKGDLKTLATVDDMINFVEKEVNGIDMDVNTDVTATSEGDGRLTGAEKVVILVKEADGTDTTFNVTDAANLEELVEKINTAGSGRVEASIDDAGKLSLYAENAAYIQTTDAADATGFGTAATIHYGQVSLTDTSGDGEVSIEFGDAADQAIWGMNNTKGGNSIDGKSAATPANFAAGDMTLNGIEIGEYDNTASYNGETAGSKESLAAFLNEYSDQTDVVVTAFNDGTDDVMRFDSVSGDKISLEYKDDPAIVTAMEGILGLKEQNATESSGGSVSSIDISTAEGAQRAIKTLDKAIEQVGAIQGELGAVNNRLDFTVSNLANVSENASAAKSRIEDADFAAESANLSRAQVLQQASQAMLAQANAAPKQVMSLLQ